MDDEAMLRLDPMLADAFRSQMKKSNNLKLINEKLHHQFRVLDLIESVIKKDERMRFVLVSVRCNESSLFIIRSLPDQYSTTDWNIDQFAQHTRLQDHGRAARFDLTSIIQSKSTVEFPFRWKFELFDRIFLDWSFGYANHGWMFGTLSIFNISGRWAVSCLSVFLIERLLLGARTNLTTETLSKVSMFAVSAQTTSANRRWSFDFSLDQAVFACG